jgi:hypothetical protein
MSYVYTFLTGLLIGILGGILVYRNNKAKLEAKETEGRKLLDALKGK